MFQLFIAKNSQLTELQNQIKNETNEFRKLKLAKKYNKQFCKYIGRSNYKDLETNYRKFLDNMTKLDHKIILVVCHSGTIRAITQIISNIDYSANASVYPVEYSISYKTPKQIYFNGNCTIMG